ncbi:MAG TPA: carbohydrate ABC transporter permease [Gaiellaceae bacterium]|jgi:multiple sugar transport system permease protein
MPDPALPPVAALEELALGGEAVAPRPVALTPPRDPAERARRVGYYALLVAFALLFFVPFIWSVATSFKTLPDTTTFSLLPHHWTLDGYREALGKYDFKRYILNSAIVAAAVTLLTLFLAGLGGYAFARLRFPGRELLFMLVLGTLMIPDQLRFVPVYQMLSKWNLIDTYQGYVLIKLGLATSLFLMRQYFLTIPRDLEEAAKLDGAGYFKTFRAVMLPLAGPALAAVAILEFQGTWNDFFWANLLLQSPNHWTLPMGLAQFTFQYSTLWPQLMAGTVIGIVPMAVIYLFFQRYFVAGVASAGVKG